MITFQPTSSGLAPKITVIGVGGAGGNAVNNMIQSHLEGVEFIVANTDAQAMAQSRADRRIQLGDQVTQGLGAGARPDIGRAAAEETLEEIIQQLGNSNMVFITAGMGGGTGTGAAPVIAQAAREHGILTVGVVTKPFHFEGQHRMRLAEAGIEELSQYVDTLIIIPNQNLFRVASEKTTFADAFKMADDVLYSGVRGVTDLMIMPGLINLDFADIRTVMSEMGKAMMGTGEATGEKRAMEAAEAAINNPLLEDISMKGARGVLINITGGMDMTLFEVDEAANRIRDEVDPDANIIFGSTFDEKLQGKMRVSVVATGIEAASQIMPKPTLISLVEQKRAQTASVHPLQQAPLAAMGSKATLAERVAGTSHVFHGSAAVAQQPVMQQEAVLEVPAAAPAASMSLAEEIARVEEEVLSVPPSAPTVPAPAEPALAHRAEPTMTVRRDAPSQGSLRMDMPAPTPRERLGDLRIDRASAVSHQPVQPASPAAREPEAAAPKPGLFSRWTSPRQPAPAPMAQQRTEPRAPAVAATPAARPAAAAPQRPAADMAATRVNPSDRLTTSKAEEDMLDIPAFLRRQAN
jgi:cell division protein FtsZ